MLAAVILALQAPALDRSGESVLRACLEAVAGLDGKRVTMVSGSRDREAEVYAMDETLALDFGKGGSFKALGTSHWGDSFLVVCDGRMLLADPLEDGRSPTVKDAPKDLGEATPQMGRHASFGGLFVMMRLGPAAFDQLADKDVPIVRKDLGVREEVAWKSKVYTNVRLVVDKKTKLPLEIVYDDLEYRKTQMGVARLTSPVASPSTRQVLYYDPLPKGTTFAVTLPEKFTDLRKKPDAAVGTIKS